MAARKASRRGSARPRARHGNMDEDESTIDESVIKALADQIRKLLAKARKAYDPEQWMYVRAEIIDMVTEEE